MITKVIFLYTVFQITVAQIDGSFWWLNKKMAKITGADPPKPVFEELKGFETDENDRIVFEDDVPFVTRGKIKANTHLQMQVNTKLNLNVTNNLTTQNDVEHVTKKDGQHSRESLEDLLEFTFPGDPWNITTIDKNIIFSESPNVDNVTDINITKPDVTTKGQPSGIIYIQNVVNPIKVRPIGTVIRQNTHNPKSEPICSYVSNNVCDKLGGTVYSKFHTIDKSCCIFPLSSRNRASRIYFPDEFETIQKSSKRFKRSAAGHKQRNAVLLRNLAGFNNFGPRLPTVPTNVATRIVTPSDDDDVDPYWNVKTINEKNSPQSDYQNTKKVYGGQEYADYATELPRPGLPGIYSDYGLKPLWPYPAINPNTYGGGSMMSEEDDDDTPSFGYATQDPRKVAKVRPVRPKVKPTKTQATSNEDYYDNESVTVQYHSNPDFKVLEGFKLLNLSRNRTKSFSKNTKTTTVNFDSEEYSATRPTFDANLDSEYPDFMDLTPSECDKSKAFERQNSPDVGNGSSPWLALATRTRKPKSVLCYATIVHPHAAVTAAECVHGMSPGEVTVLSGIWDLSKDRGNSQQRLASVLANPKYVSGKMANNIALLHWKVPLRFGSNVRAVSMSDPHVGDDCQFIGWGGYDIAMRPKPRRQIATILTPRACKTRLSANRPGFNLPKEDFCATIDHQATVTGTGGPLTCKMDEKSTLVGIAVLRDNIIVLQPVDWAIQAADDLQL